MGKSKALFLILKATYVTISGIKKKKIDLAAQTGTYYQWKGPNIDPWSFPSTFQSCLLLLGPCWLESFAFSVCRRVLAISSPSSTVLRLHNVMTPNCQGSEREVSRSQMLGRPETEKNRCFTFRCFLTASHCGKLLWSAAPAARNLRMSGNTCSLGTTLELHQWMESQSKWFHPVNPTRGF